MDSTIGGPCVWRIADLCRESAIRHIGQAVIDHASAKVSDANATETHARNSQTLGRI